MTSDYVVSFPGLGIEGIELNRVAFSIFGLSVYWYGLLIAAAAMLSIFLALRSAKKFHLDEDYILDNFLIIVPGMIIGSRLYYVAFTWDMYKDDLLSVFDTRKGGLAFYGGVIGAVLGVLIYHWIKKKNVEPLADYLIVYVPLGQAIGRLGNFINQEAFGTNTTLPWGMISNGTSEYLAAHPELGQDPMLPVHPTFLYEFVGNLILFAILLQFRKKNKIPFGTASLYVIGYGFIRYFVEGIRTDSLYIQGTTVRVSQLLSALMVVGGILYLILMRNKRRKEKAIEEDEILESFAEEKNEKTSVSVKSEENADEGAEEKKAEKADEANSVQTEAIAVEDDAKDEPAAEATEEVENDEEVVSAEKVLDEALTEEGESAEGVELPEDEEIESKQEDKN